MAGKTFSRSATRPTATAAQATPRPAPPAPCVHCGSGLAPRFEAPSGARRRRALGPLLLGLALLAAPALAPLWSGPLARLLVPSRAARGGIVEEAGRRFLLAALSTAAALCGARLVTTAVGPGPRAGA